MGNRYYNKFYLFGLIASVLICYQLFRVSLHGHKTKFTWNETQENLQEDPMLENAFLRHNLLFKPYKIHLSPDAEGSEVERVFIEASESVEVFCSKSVRIGNVDDGGWNVCEFGNLLPKEPCIVYSFGINDDWSFDDGIVNKYRCFVRSFDPSLQIQGHWRNSKNVFLKEGLGGRDTILDNFWRMNTLKTIRNIFQEDDTLIDYIKFDIEGSEWEVLNTSIRDGSLLKVKQLAFEMHTDEMSSKRTPTFKLRYYLDLLNGLRDLGFYRWYTHRNVMGPMISSEYSGMDIWCCHEVVYLNINYL